MFIVCFVNIVQLIVVLHHSFTFPSFIAYALCGPLNFIFIRRLTTVGRKREECAGRLSI